MLTATLHRAGDPQPLPGTLHVNAGGLVFTPTSGESATGGAAAAAAVTLPLDALRARLGGFDDAFLFLAHPSLPGLEVGCAAAAALAEPALGATPAVAALGRRRRRRVGRFWGCLGSLGVSLLAVVIAGVLAWGQLVSWAVERIPRDLERQLGQAAYASVAAGGSVVDDGELRADLARLCEPLFRAGAPRVELHVLADDTVNAFALPGGPIVVHRGLIERAARAEEVLGVLGHELAHVEGRHGLRQLVNNLGLTLVVQLILGDTSALAGVANELVNLSYSRDLEREADRRGVELLAAAGVDPSGLLDFFSRLAAEEESGGPGAPAVALLSTHPASAERVTALAALLAERVDEPAADPIDPETLAALRNRLRPAEAPAGEQLP